MARTHRTQQKGLWTQVIFKLFCPRKAVYSESPPDYLFELEVVVVENLARTFTARRK